MGPVARSPKKRKHRGPRKRTPSPPKLTPKQAAFVEAYLANGGNATEAAATAGYAGNRTTLAAVGSENLKKPLVVQALAGSVADGARDLAITSSKVLKDIEEVRVRALRDGRYSAALAASRLQGETLALFRAKIEVVPSIDEVTTGELVTLLGELMGQVDDDTRSDLAGVVARNAPALSDSADSPGTEAQE